MSPRDAATAIIVPPPVDPGHYSGLYQPACGRLYRPGRRPKIASSPMKTTFSPARWRMIPALALVALAAAVAPAATAGAAAPVARAADPDGTVAVASPGGSLDWKSCALGPDDTEGKDLDRAGARCAELA